MGDGDTKLEGLTMYKDYLYEVTGYNEEKGKMYRLYDIYSIALLLESQRFTSTGNFDRISTALLAMFEFKKDTLIKRMELFKDKNKNSNKPIKDKLRRR